MFITFYILATTVASVCLWGVYQMVVRTRRFASGTLPHTYPIRVSTHISTTTPTSPTSAYIDLVEIARLATPAAHRVYVIWQTGDGVVLGAYCRN